MKPLKNSYVVSPQRGVQVHYVPDDVMVSICCDHPEAQFDRMFNDGRIREFPRKPDKARIHRYIVIESIMLEAMIMGKVRHENRCEVFFRMPECPSTPPNNLPTCSYCPFISHGCARDMVCPMYTTLHVRGLMNVAKEKQRREEVCQWLLRHERFISKSPTKGQIKFIPPGRVTLGNEGNQFRISRHQILHFICELPIPMCKNNPFVFPKEAGQSLFNEYGQYWQRAFGGKILKTIHTSCSFPGEMNFESNMIRFKMKMECDIVNIPKENDIMGFQLHSVGVEKENAHDQQFKKIDKFKLMHGRELLSRTMRLADFPGGWLSLHYDAMRMQVLSPAFIIKIRGTSKQSHFVNLVIKNCWITGVGLMCEVDSTNFSNNLN